MPHMLAEVAPKSPLIPLFQRGNFLRCYLNPSLEKRGRGDLTRTLPQLFDEFQIRHTSSESTIQNTSMGLSMNENFLLILLFLPFVPSMDSGRALSHVEGRTGFFSDN